MTRSGLAAALFLSLPSLDAAPPRYVVQLLPGARVGTDGWASALTSRGELVYSSFSIDVLSGEPKGHLYSRGRVSEVRPFRGRASVSDINNRGEIIGRSSRRGHPFLIRDGKEIDLYAATGGKLVWAYDINNPGQICGWQIAGGVPRPARWTNGTLVALDLPDGYTGGEATSINDASQMIGYFRADGANDRAFFFSDGILTLLGTADKPSRAVALSENGQVVFKSGDEWIRWTEGGQYPLTVTPSGGSEVQVAAINSRGQVLGRREQGLNPGVLWTGDVMSELEDLVSPYFRYGHLPYNEPRVFTFNEQGVISAATDHGQLMLLWPVSDGVPRPRLFLEGSRRRVTDRARITLRGTTLGDTVSVIGSAPGEKVTFAEGTRNWTLEMPVRPGRTVFTVTAHGRGGDSQPMRVTVVRR